MGGGGRGDPRLPHRAGRGRAPLRRGLGFGYHYGVDLLAGVVFALTVEAGMRAFARGWDRPAGLLVAYGTTVLTALLLSYRWLPTEMAARPWLFGPLLLLSTASVIHAHLRTTAHGESTAVPPPQRKPQPEPA